MRLILSFLVLLLPIMAATAGELNLRGYGTVGVVHALDDGASYLRDLGQPKGVSDGATELYTDTRFGLQLDYAHSNDLTFTVQALSKYQADATYTPEITWAFAKYTLAPGLDLRVGRTKLDFIFQADEVNLGFPSLTVRPPIDFYSLPLAPSDGFDLDYSTPLNDGYFTSSLNIGWATADDIPYYDEVYNLHGSPLFGGSMNYETMDWSLKLSYGQIKPKQDPGPLLGLIDLVRPYSEELADSYSPKDKWIRYYSLGGTWNIGNWQGAAAFGAHRSESQMYPSSNQILFKLGYRLNKLVPYVAFSSKKTNNDIIYLNTGTFIDAYASQTQTFSQSDQKTYSVGTRYDLTSNIALKAQFDFIESEPTLSSLVKVETDDWDGNLRLFNVALDYYF